MDKKWNLQDIKPANSKRKSPSQARRRQAVKESAPASNAQPKVSTWLGNQGEKSNKRSYLWPAVVVFIAIIAGGFGLSALMDGAKVTVYPRHREPTVNAAFTAYKAPAESELGYEIMSLEADGERQVTATGEEEVSEQATGEILISKTTAGEERLIKNTRFESEDGLIFRITESAVVPGGTADEPGTVTAKVFADEAGAEHNLTAGQQFTVPGFAEGGFDELYGAISAENTSAFSGGFSGPKFIVDEAELESAKSELHDELSTALLARVDSERPAGFTLFADSVVTRYESLQSKQVGEGQVSIKERVILQIPIFKNEDFSTFIAANVVPGYEGEPVRLDKVDELQFSYTGSTTPETDISTADSIAFSLQGKPIIVWTFDEEQLKADLLGASRTALNTILGGYPAIERAGAVMRPVWKRSFPSKLGKITIIESLEDKEE